MPKKITCKAGLKKNVISKKVFDREMKLCKMLAMKNKGKCGWGKCKDCGVVLLLVKLHKGKLVERSNEIGAIRKKYLT